MESRAFIKSANLLIERIQQNRPEDKEEEARAGLQKEVTRLFSGLQNPSLVTAGNLRDAALAADFEVRPDVLNRIAEMDALLS